MSLRIPYHITLAVGIAALAGCSGSNPPNGARPAILKTTLRPTSNGTISITIPGLKSASSARRRPKFVSPSTTSAAIVVNSLPSISADVGPNSVLCQPASGSRVCAIPIFAPVGSATIAISLYDSQGLLLGQGTSTATVTVGQAFSATVTINPTVASISSPIFTFATGTRFLPGVQNTATFSAITLDADGNALPSTATVFATPLTLSSTDPNITISPTTWTSSGQNITLSYNGSTSVAGSVGFRIVASSTTLANLAVIGPTVSTFSGEGYQAFSDGPGNLAHFNGVSGIAIDTSGYVYVADDFNNRIRKISPQGFVSTLAGTGATGANNGPGSTATFSSPTGVAVDVSGNVFVADSQNNAIRKITSGGSVSTLAGTGAAGAGDGPGTSATFHSPSGIAIDVAGNLYVTDTANNKIRKITSTGVVSTIAGNGNSGFTDGAGAAATFNNPSAVAVDPSGANIYVADTFNNKVRKVTSGGMVSTLAGTGASGLVNGLGTSAQFKNDQGITVDSSGTIFVSDFSNNVVRKIDTTGTVTTYAGTGTLDAIDGPAGFAAFGYPWGVAVASDGTVYVSDNYANKIRKITP